MKRQKKNSEKFIKAFTQGAAELFSQLYILKKPHQNIAWHRNQHVKSYKIREYFGCTKTTIFNKLTKKKSLQQTIPGVYTAVGPCKM